MNGQRFVITVHLWQQLEPHFLEKASDAGPRQRIIACFWKQFSGDSDLLTMAEPGNWNSQFRRFRRWVKAGVFESLFNAMCSDPDLEYALIDATIVRVHQKAPGPKEDSSSGHRALARRLDG
ncbi:transposase [Roseovarius sp. A21]|uniref:Transposase n=1 Tax=Roseovarius bejariae TaxID=2576383 RepID=A0A844CSI2_9RHOB|nr:transposase [Roseovarius bejariae]MRU14959.1 transposase [Roseovarius bejariae]